jgi:hypothetical protein
MSKQLARRNVRAGPRRLRHNSIMFPRALREAIPDWPTCIGRELALASMDGAALDNFLFGPHVQVCLTVKETGNLTGEFPVHMYLHTEAARTLGETLTRLADQAEQMSSH